MNEQEIFLNALRHESETERMAYVKSCCGTDKELGQRVQALLKAHADNGTILAQPAAGRFALGVPKIAEGPGSTVGVYRLLQQIGEGGFGVVYMAEQTEPVRRKVALKIIKPGMDTKEIIARFESERQALALMDHPNIARVLDAGATASGRPYFVMELVKGVPITEFCDKNRLSVTDRLALYVPVCMAVQHAHHKGVIHRDIKPSNVMVTLHDGKPVPKVIDFGVAKATSQQLTQHTLFTAYGQMIGTPLYMSPEQAEMSGLDIDTRSDIYSLGVLLYELLTGTTPIEQKKLREAGLAEMQRLIRDVEAPRPSTRLSSLNEAATVQISANRGTDLKRLNDLLRGDVDWIVMKALEKDRQRRYDTPTAFAEDIQRCLSHEAIQARPPSTTYRLQKFIQRNKRLAAGIGTVAATLLLGVLVSSGFAIYANAQLKRARLAESGLQVSLIDAQREQKIAEDERDRATKAELAQVELTQVAEQRRQDTETARSSEAEQRQEAERQRQEAVKLNSELTKSVEEQRRALYASDMNLVRIEAQRSNLKRMREILMDQLPIHGEEDLRGFEWNYWYRFMNQAKVLMRFDNFKYGQPDSAAAIVPGGKLVAVTRGDQTEIREVSTGKVLSKLPFQLRILADRTRFSSTGRCINGVCNSIAAYIDSSESFSRRLVRAGSLPGSECTVFEPTGEKTTFTFPSQSFSHVSCLNISPDGKLIVALGNEVSHKRDAPACRILVWDVGSQKIVMNQVQHRELNRAEFSPDGQLLAVYLCLGTKRQVDESREVVVVIDISTGEELGIARYTDYIKGVVSPDGRLLAVSSIGSSRILLIDTQTGTIFNTLHNEAATVDTLTFSEDGMRIIASTTAGEIVSWDLDRNDDSFGLSSHPMSMLATYIDNNKNQTRIAIAHSDGALVYRTREGDETILKPAYPMVASATQTARGVSMIEFSDDSRYLAHWTDIGPDGKLLAVRSATRIGQDGKPSVIQNSASSRSVLELYDLQVNRRLWQVIIPDGISLGGRRVDSLKLEFSADRQYLLVWGAGKTWRVMKCTTGEDVSPVQDKYFFPTSLIRLHPSMRPAIGGVTLLLQTGNAGASALVADAIIVKDVITGEPIQRSKLPLSIDGQESLRSRIGEINIYPSPDGVHIALLPPSPAKVEIWNLSEGRRLVDVVGNSVEFSPDGKRVAISKMEKAPFYYSGSEPPSAISHVTLWDIPKGKQVCEISLTGHPADVVRFSPDGQRLLTLHGKKRAQPVGLYPRGDYGTQNRGVKF